MLITVVYERVLIDFGQISTCFTLSVLTWLNTRETQQVSGQCQCVPQWLHTMAMECFSSMDETQQTCVVNNDISIHRVSSVAVF